MRRQALAHIRGLRGLVGLERASWLLGQSYEKVRRWKDEGKLGPVYRIGASPKVSLRGVLAFYCELPARSPRSGGEVLDMDQDPGIIPAKGTLGDYRYVKETLGCSRSMAYKLMGSGKEPGQLGRRYRIGSSVKVLKSEVLAYRDRCAEDEAGQLQLGQA